MTNHCACTLSSSACFSSFTSASSILVLSLTDSTVCKKCGSLIFRRAENPAFKGQSILRCGGLDDPKLRDTVFKPTMELFTKYREDWLPPLAGLDQFEAMP